MISNININEFMKLKGVKIIDIRSVEKYNDNHIPDAINIPSEKLLLNPYNYLEKETRYYIYCQRGMSSYNICGILTRLGFKVTNINGGYESWIMKRNQK